MKKGIVYILSGYLYKRMYRRDATELMGKAEYPILLYHSVFLSYLAIWVRCTDSKRPREVGWKTWGNRWLFRKIISES